MLYTTINMEMGSMENLMLALTDLRVVVGLREVRPPHPPSDPHQVLDVRHDLVQLV